MEAHNSCPICFEIFENEIYQCPNGHIICARCKGSVNNCPQCRVSFGATSIRCRVLEEILDAQNFDCNFKDKGCSQKCKRSEISSHAKACYHNPNFVDLCRAIGYQDCKFNVTTSSRLEIIKHFQDVHKAVYAQGEFFQINHINFYGTNNGGTLFWAPILLGFGTSEISPLILLLGKVNLPLEFASWISIQIYGTENPGQCFKMTVALQKVPSEKIRSNPTMTAGFQDLQISWTLISHSLKLQTLDHFQSHIQIPLSYINSTFLTIGKYIVLSVSKKLDASELTEPFTTTAEMKEVWVNMRNSHQAFGKLKLFIFLKNLCHRLVD
ncbi:unnamed protein product [Orchesella dallaii]|uniref:RING-type E3 ubiquitin transferase n=1 Tax=Orchesella dallaii TaxID=48710 RepID=A0ABP1QIN6_9HEXA